MVEAGLSAIAITVALFCVVIPLAAYLWMRGVDAARLALACAAITGLWLLIQRPVHEASHVLGGILSGAPATSFSVIPDSWTDFFAKSFQGHGLSGTMWQKLIWLAGPYWVDAVMLMLGSWLFRRQHSYSPYTGAVVLTVTGLRSIFDLVHNYLAGWLLNSGDYQQLLSSYPPVAVHACTVFVIALGALWILLVIDHAQVRE